MLDYARIAELTKKGYCCSQIILQVGLEQAQKEVHPDLIQAAAGLCLGLHSGLDCGILSGAACLIALCLPAEAPELIRELTDWFKSTYELPGGGMSCRDLLAGNEMNRLTRCPKMLLETYDKMVELLEERGFRFGAD
ncbi:MAG: C_GCAxxG_C_C family protein [Firmicutes bacterium]|jgi:hypothetical protein|nr:C_GCAxxG_C_C family protein [Bacillota bacterium]